MDTSQQNSVPVRPSPTLLKKTDRTMIPSGFNKGKFSQRDNKMQMSQQLNNSLRKSSVFGDIQFHQGSLLRRKSQALEDHVKSVPKEQKIQGKEKSNSNGRMKSQISVDKIKEKTDRETLDKVLGPGYRAIPFSQLGVSEFEGALPPKPHQSYTYSYREKDFKISEQEEDDLSEISSKVSRGKFQRSPLKSHTKNSQSYINQWSKAEEDLVKQKIIEKYERPLQLKIPPINGSNEFFETAGKNKNLVRLNEAAGISLVSPSMLKPRTLIGQIFDDKKPVKSISVDKYYGVNFDHGVRSSLSIPKESTVYDVNEFDGHIAFKNSFYNNNRYTEKSKSTSQIKLDKLKLEQSQILSIPKRLLSPISKPTCTTQIENN